MPLRGCAVRVVAGAVLLLATQGAPVRAEAPPPRGEPREDCIATYCQQDAIYQFGPAAGFAASLYEGPTYFSEVLRLGDFGLGATSPLDGEVIILDGTPYRAAVTGELEILSPTTRTPLVFVKHFRADRTVELPAVASLDDLVRTLDEEIGSKNLFWAARIDGRFTRVELRSVPRQERPYKPLADVVAGQNVFTASDVTGTLVGFRFPAYLGGVNTSGWHFHFVDDARKLGGHVLDVQAPDLVAALDRSRVLTLALPDDPDFESADLDAARGDAAFRAAIRPKRTVPDATPAPGSTDLRGEPENGADVHAATRPAGETEIVVEPATKPGSRAASPADAAAGSVDAAPADDAVR